MIPKQHMLFWHRYNIENKYSKKVLISLSHSVQFLTQKYSSRTPFPLPHFLTALVNFVTTLLVRLSKFCCEVRKYGQDFEFGNYPYLVLKYVICKLLSPCVYIDFWHKTLRSPQLPKVPHYKLTVP